MKVIIIGGVAGGASAAARIRRLDETAQIIVLERSNYVSYANCGLPYFIGGVIREQAELTLQTPQSFWERFHIDVRVRNEAVDIDVKSKTVAIRRLDTGEIYHEQYDKLLLSPGAKPVVPHLPGVTSDRIFSLRTVEDTLRIRKFIEEYKPATAVLVGGGFIGLEMAENLTAMGISVTVIQRSNQLFVPMDADMASFIHAQMRSHGVKLELEKTVTGFSSKGGKPVTMIKDSEPISSDMVLLGVGVEPDTALAEKLADEFIANADEVRMDRAAIIDTFKAYVLVQKLMDHYECNAFTAPCPDLCSTRRLSEERVTFCLTHSLNIENGIPSACDLDFNSLLTQAILENLSGKSVYMGNANVCSLEDGKLPTIFGDFDDAHIDHLDDKTNLYSMFHATPTRKFDGFEQPLKKYSVDSFAYSGFGATVRYDFMQDEGQEITVCRIDPTGTKMLAAKGTIVASAGYDGKSCGQGLFFRVADNKDLFYKQCEFGCHLTLVYGDYIEDLKKFGKVTGIEIVTA